MYFFYWKHLFWLQMKYVAIVKHLETIEKYKAM